MAGNPPVATMSEFPPDIVTHRRMRSFDGMGKEVSGMCGRFYVSEAELDDFAALVERIEKDLLKPHSNGDGTTDLLPGDAVPVLVPRAVESHGGVPAGWEDLSEIGAMRVLEWGFPAPQGKGRIINARSETVLEKPIFRLPFQAHRCLVPARGFYEWSDPPAGAVAEGAESEPTQLTLDGFLPPYEAPEAAGAPKRRPHRIRHRFLSTEGRLIAMAGLYWTFRPTPLTTLTAFTILTVPSNPDVAPVHDRMPLILDEPARRIWLAPGRMNQAAGLLVPAPAGSLRMVSD